MSTYHKLAELQELNVDNIWLPAVYTAHTSANKVMSAMIQLASDQSFIILILYAPTLAKRGAHLSGVKQNGLGKLAGDL